MNIQITKVLATNKRSKVVIVNHNNKHHLFQHNSLTVTSTNKNGHTLTKYYNESNLSKAITPIFTEMKELAFNLLNNDHVEAQVITVKRKVRIEEVLISPDKDFTKNEWIESETLQYANTLQHKNQTWIVVETR